MTELLLQTAKLIPSNTRMHPTAGSALVYCKEDPNPKSALGSMMIIIEILGPTKKAEELIDFIVNTAEANYFSPDHKDQNIEVCFEQTIRQLNLSLNDKKEIKQWPGRISAVIAAIKNDNLILTSSGSAEAYIFRGQKHTNITSGLDDRNAPGHFFNNVARGQVSIGDQIAIVTPALLHQISQTELKSIVGNFTPASAVAKIAQLIENQPNTSRTAALIAAVTTAELMAMNVRTGEPDEVSVSRPLTLPSLSPAAGKANKAVAAAGKLGWHGLRNRVLPFLRNASQKAVARIRNYNNPLPKPVLIGFAALILVGLIYGGATMASSRNLNKMQEQYETAYQLVKSSESNLDAHDKAGASNNLNESKRILDALSGSPQKTALEKRLQQANRPADDPASVAGLLDVVQGKQDQIDNIMRVDANVIHKFAGDKINKTPKYIEPVGSKIIAVSPSNAQITVLDAGGKVLSSNEGKKEIGEVTGVTPNASDDGLFIMTSQPALWLYKIDGNSLTKQEVSLGSLVKGSAIGSYNGNIYILSESGVFKHTPTLSGFSVPTPAIKTPTTPSAKGASTMAIDGSIYLGGGPQKVTRYLAGVPSHQSKDLPDAFSKPSQIRIINDDRIYVVSNDNSRIAVLKLIDKELVYDRQISIKNTTKIDTTALMGGDIYILSSGKLLKSKARL